MGKGKRGRWSIIAGALAIVSAAVATTLAVRPMAWTGGVATVSTAGSPALSTVERRTVSARQQVSGALGYAGEYHVVNQANGTVTALPGIGQVLNQGDVLYRVDGAPVVLLYGSTPTWRDLDAGVRGPDATQLNAALVALGYGPGLDPASDTVTWATQQAVRKLQAALGRTGTGALRLGEVVFLPGPLRVTAVSATLGAPAGPGQTIVEATSTTPEVLAEVPVGLAGYVTPGDAVVVTLPDMTMVDATVTSVGTVASRSEVGAATIPVVIALNDPAAAAGLDQAPVLVSITTDTVENALVVPVTAILALAGGEYAVEVADDRGTHVVPVQLGLFDSGGGVVEVTAAGLQPGDRVVVPSP